MHALTEADVRNRLASRLGRKVPDPIWDRLVRNRQVQEVIGGWEGAFDALEERARDDLKLVSEMRAPSLPPSLRVFPPDDRLQVLSRLFADSAAEDKKVGDWRRKYLPEGLLDASGIEDWIRIKQREDGPPTQYRRYAMRPAKDPEPAQPDLDDFVESSWEILSYTLDDDLRYALQVGRNGCLDELRQLARYLLSKFGWSEESAVRFVLTGEVPLIPRAQVSVKTFGLSLGSPGAYIRVHLDVDPSVPPEQLTRWFREIRQRLVPGRRRSPVRSERALVDLVHDHPSLTWGERVRQWNSDHPDEKAYPSAQQMARDYHRAIQHALDVRIPWLDGDQEKA